MNLRDRRIRLRRLSGVYLYIELAIGIIIDASQDAYDLTFYSHAWDFPPASVDRRHLFWLYDILCRGRFENVLEIGCFYGASSTAFVEALNRDLIGRATFCDIEIHPKLLRTLAHCRFPSRIQVNQKSSVELLQSTDHFDFIFVDGDHRLETVAQEVELLIDRRPICIMAHDTNAQAAGFPDCDGPPFLKWRFMTTSPYLCLEDSACRPGELTHRGMFLGTTSKSVFECAQKSLEKWGAVSFSPKRVDI